MKSREQASECLRPAAVGGSEERVSDIDEQLTALLIPVKAALRDLVLLVAARYPREEERQALVVAITRWCQRGRMERIKPILRALATLVGAIHDASLRTDRRG